jgi:hypothetical protein
MGGDKVPHCLEIHGIQSHILAYLIRTRIAGGNKKLRALLALGYLVCYGVLAAARSKEKYIHIIEVYVLTKYRLFVFYKIAKLRKMPDMAKFFFLPSSVSAYLPHLQTIKPRFFPFVCQ